MLDENGAARCAHEIFEKQAAETPDAIAAEHETAQLTYADLNRQANRLAHHLRSLGVGPEVCVALCVERSLDVLVGLLAILKAGGAYVPLDPTYPAERLSYMLSDARAAVLVTHARLEAKLPKHAATVVRLDADSSRWENLAETNPESKTTPQNAMYIVYTSGSTGRPKGVVIEHHSAVAHLAAITTGGVWGEGRRRRSEAPNVKTGRYAAPCRVLHRTSLSFDASVLELLGPLFAGGCVVMAPHDAGAAPAALASLVRRSKVTYADVPPALLAYLLDEPDFVQAESLRFIAVGGEALPPALAAAYLERCRAELSNEYGPTEATISATWWPVARYRETGSIRIGRPIPGYDVYVVGTNGALNPVGVPGELCIAGVGLTRGYLARPRMTAERFVPNPFSEKPGARLYRTGDLARWTEDGEIDFLGRMDDQVKIRGYRIELGEIEAVLSLHPAVRHNVVVVRDEGPGGKHLVAYVEPAEIEEASLREHLSARLPSHMVPTTFVRLDALPLTHNGKVDRKALPAPEHASRDTGTPYTAPRTPAEQILADAFAQVLELERVGIHDNFFNLGGHSLLATQVVSRLRKALGIELPLQALFEAPTVAALSEVVASFQGTLAPHHARPLERVSRDALSPPIPMSFSQRRLWFLDQMDPGRATYNVFSALRISGPLDVEALRRTLGEIVRRHEALRTTFERHGDTAVQVVHALQEPWLLPIVQITGESANAVETEVERRVREESATPFDLERGPLFRNQVLRIDDQHHVLLMTMHHIVSDGWSMGVLFREIEAGYGAFSAGRPSPLPELEIQLVDVSCWQRDFLQGEWLAKELAYWKARMKDCPPLVLPTDRPRPSSVLFRGRTRPIALSRALASGLDRLARTNGATLFMALMGAFQILLGRYSRQHDFCVGMPIANRTRVEMEPLIGFFVNTLVLRARLDENPTFLELLRRVREVSLEAYTHQDMPFERLVEEIEVGRDISRNPVFQVMFVLQNAREGKAKLPGLDVSAIDVFNDTTTFDLTLSLQEQEDGSLAGVVQYAVDLFDEGTIDRLCGHYTRLLEGIVEDPGCRIEELPLLTEGERRSLATQWDSAQGLPAEEMCIHQLFERQVERTPDAVAAIFGTQQWTYRELNARANQVAHRLRALGIARQTRVGICVERSPEMLAGILGILKAGGAYVPLEPEYPRDRLASMLRDAGAATVVTQSRFVEQLPSDCQKLCFDRDREILAAENTVSLACETTAADLAYVIYTSGSTGQPKGTMVAHENIVSSTVARQQVYEEPVHRLVLGSSLAFDITTGQIYWTLCTGGALVLLPDAFHKNPEGTAATIAKEQVSHLVCVASLYQLLLEQPRARELFSSLKTVVLGGEAMAPKVVSAHREIAPQAALYNEYGPTEATVWSSFHRLTLENGSGGSIPIGRPIPGTRILVLDEHLQPVPWGVAGELCIGGAGVTLGYLNRPDITRQKFINNPFGSGRLYKTGDLGRLLPDGNIEFLGRVDHQIKFRGYRIELGEIESLATSFPGIPGIQNAVAIVREDTPGDRRLCLYVVRDKASSATTAQDLGHDQVSAWRSFFDQAPPEEENRTDALFNISGWNSSYSKQPIPAEEMRAWRDGAIERIRELRPSRVWEIGSGSGLILLPLAPSCAEYLGTDFSAAGIASLKAAVALQGFGHVRLEQREAADCEGIPERHFNVVVLNSVVQYFPDADYLRRVLEGVARSLAPGGAIFLGDIRNHDLLEAFHTSVHRYRKNGEISNVDWNDVRRDIAKEEELLVSPAYLRWLCARIEGLSHAEIYIKRGRGENEMIRYRYDAIVFSKSAPAVEIDSRQTWTQIGATLDELAKWLEKNRPKTAEIAGIPNARVFDDFISSREFVITRRRRPDEKTDGPAIHPESLWELAERLGYRLRLRYSEDHGAGAMDALWELGPAESPVRAWTNRREIDHSSIADGVNNPLRGTQEREISARLRSYFEERLPEYMVPSAMVMLENLPLTTNGKIDRKALPPPGRDRSPSAGHIAPRTPMEVALAEIWAAVLGVPRVGLQDDFFALGGHSLLVVQAINRVRDILGVEMTVQSLFANPTIAQLAVALESERGTHTVVESIPAIPRGPDTRFPLSYAQERIWRLDQRSDWTAHFNMSIALRLLGPLDRNALVAALKYLVERHESMRTATFSEGGVLWQRILGPASIPVVWEDISALGPEAQAAEVHARGTSETEYRFEIGDEPLCRIRLLALGPEKHALLVTMHHSVCDGWSMGVLAAELAAAYRSHATGKTPDLAPSSFQFADYGAWERARFGGETLERLLAYWRDTLRDAPILKLRTDHPRPKRLSDRGGIVPVKLSTTLSGELEALAQANSTTLFIVLLATWQLLLCRYSGQDDIVVGTLIANRTRRDVERLIGCFINLLALRTDLSGNPSFGELVRRVNATATAAYQHQSAPIELVIDAANAVRDPSRRPLFQTMAVLQNAPSAEHPLADGIRSEHLHTGPDQVSRFELMLSMTKTPAGLKGIIRYSTDLYEAATVERIGRDLQRLLAEVVAAPNHSLTALAEAAKVGFMQRETAISEKLPEMYRVE